MMISVEERVAVLESYRREALAYRELRETKDEQIMRQLKEIQTQVTLTKGAIGMFTFMISCLAVGINMFLDNLKGI